MEFTEEYPNKPPIVKFVSKMFHPNGKYLNFVKHIQETLYQYENPITLLFPLLLRFLIDNWLFDLNNLLIISTHHQIKMMKNFSLFQSMQMVEYVLIFYKTDGAQLMMSPQY